MNICGIDYSLTCPAMNILDTDKELKHDNFKFYFNQANVSDREYERREELNLKNIFCQRQFIWNNNYTRFLVLADYFVSIAIINDVKVAVIENYALGATGQVFGIAECTGILKYLFMMAGIKEMYALPPSTVKKKFSGMGNAEKGVMITTYKNKYGVDIPQLFEKDGNYGSPYSDIVDSHAMIYTYLNMDVLEREKYRIF